MKFKLPSSYTILFLIIVAVAALTWIVPAGEYDKVEGGKALIAGTYHTVPQNPQGLFEILKAPINGFLGTKRTSGAVEISLFILIMGGFLGVINRTGAMDAGIALTVRKCHGDAKMLMIMLMILCGLGGTTFGMAEECVAFLPLVLPIMLATRLDPIVGVACLLLGAKIGTLGSTVNPFATGVASEAIKISIASGMNWRLLIWVTNIGLATVYLYRYAVRVERNEANSLMADSLAAERAYWKGDTTPTEITSSQKTVLWLMAFTFLLMTVSLIPWDTINKSWTFFETANNAILGLPVIGPMLGKIPPLGTWEFREISLLFLFMAVVIGLVARLNEGEIVQSFLAGSRDLLGVSFIVAVARGIQVVMNDGFMTATVLHWGENALTGLSPAVFSVLTYIFYLPLSFLIPSTSGLAGATIPITGGLAQFAHVPAHVVVTAFQSASGIVNIITPTSGALMAGLALGRINYGVWLKFVMKLVVMLFVLDLVIIAAAATFSS